MTQRQPAFGPGFYNLGQCYTTLHQVDKAIAAFETGLQIGGVEFECCLLLGQIQANAGHWESAEKYFRRALGAREKLDSWYFSAATYLVKTLREANKQPAAIKFAQDLAAQAPGHPEVIKIQQLARSR
jgi:tetratricopeptide (TPR) repeat protein